jgi:hypothetical protein
MTSIPLSKIGEVIVQRAPSTSEKVFIMKRPSFPKGIVPEHLKDFKTSATGLNKCPVGCKGSTGLDYTACLRSCASKIDFKKPTPAAPAPAALGPTT